MVTSTTPLNFHEDQRGQETTETTKRTDNTRDIFMLTRRVIQRQRNT